MLKLYVKDFSADNIVVTWEGEGSLKREIINDDYVNVLVGKIKNRKPNVIEFKTDKLSELFTNELIKHSIYINNNGKLFYDEATGYNKLDKEVESSNAYELIVRNEDFAQQLDILMSNNYIVEIKEIGDKTKFIIHGQVQ